MIKDSTINGMTVEEMRASLTEDWGWDRAPTDVVLSLLDALESAQREADEAKKEAAANKGNADNNYAKWCAERERAEKAEAQAAEMKENVTAQLPVLTRVWESMNPDDAFALDLSWAVHHLQDAISSSAGNKALAVIEAAKELRNTTYQLDKLAGGTAHMEADRAFCRALAEFEGGGK